jgi:hypothetical protein
MGRPDSWSTPEESEDMLPNFLIIGAQKAGTSSLYRYLRDHPQIFMSDLKEPDFFVEERNWSLGRAWYEQLFASAGDALAVGEASTSYTMYPMYGGVPQRIAEMIPDVRLVYLIRDPIERMRSDYLHYRNLRDGALARLKLDRETDPPERALLSKPHYLQTSCYALQIERYLAHFPREHLLVITSEMLRRRRLDILKRIFAFLGVDPEWNPATLHEEFNRTADARAPTEWARAVRRVPGYGAFARLIPLGVKRMAKQRLLITGIDREEGEIPDSLRRLLRERLREDVERLRRYVDEDLDGWGMA